MLYAERDDVTALAVDLKRRGAGIDSERGDYVLQNPAGAGLSVGLDKHAPMGGTRHVRLTRFRSPASG